MSTSFSSTFAPIQTLKPVTNVTKPIAKPEEKKTKLSKTQIGIGVGAALVGSAIIATMIAKGNFSGAKKVLAEHIDFKKAETLEDAIKFGKEHLGIKNYHGFETADLDVINWVNEGLVNTSNALKGKAKLPQKVLYTELEGNTVAGVTPDKKSLAINKKYCSDLDTHIKKRLSDLKESSSFELNKDGNFTFKAWMIGSSKEQTVQRFNQLQSDILKINKGELKTFDEKLQCLENLRFWDDLKSATYASPDITLKRLISTPGVKDILGKKGIEVDISKLNDLPQKEKHKLINTILKAGYNEEKYLGSDIKSGSRFKVIYHELGHLNDKNLERNCFAAYHEHKSPKKIKALNDWVTNPDKMQAAGSVSYYAQSDAAEFFAETFAHICDGKEVTKEAMDLYKELGGIIV